MTPNPTTRYAIYWAPPAESALWRFGSRWLGRDAATGAALPGFAIAGLEPAQLAAWTAAPRLYGLHATLKPPFRLAPGRTRDALIAALERFAATAAPAPGPPLVLQRLGHFLALVPDGPIPAIAALAARLVAEFDPFRAPPPPAELARRRAHALTPSQDENLVRWGYPYVMAEFRFHVTLTDSLEPGPLAALEAALAPRVAALGPLPLSIDEIALFEQPDSERPFQLATRFALRG